MFYLFLLFCRCKGTDSYLVLWESADGIRFEKKAEIRDNMKPYLHNCGWSGDERGYIKCITH